ncbi:hypothetical protein [Streptomyces sp. NPDC005438]|uniref:hypothetical protein n=1 Tax=Streptomyces sp. NPDC005438 TaxID=3156880 RepID=UPI0033B0D8F6
MFETEGGSRLPAITLPVLVTVPWWLGALCVVTLAAGQLRALMRERASRQYDENFVATVNHMNDPAQQVQALLEYRKAGVPQEEPPPSDPSTWRSPPPRGAEGGE